ncbi:MAG: GGDEF domain-containing protein [Actinomycetota bacterium]
MATPTLTDALQRGRVGALIPAVRKSMFTSGVSVVMFSVILFRFSPTGLAAWLAIRLLVSACCVAALDRLTAPGRRVQDQLRWLVGIMGVSGVVWGLIPAFVRPDSPEWAAVVVLWLFGNQSVVTAVASPARPVFLAAIGSVTLVGAVAIGIGGDSFDLVLAALLMLGGVYSVAIFASLHRTVEAAINARWEVSSLAESLAARTAELESTNEVLADLASHDALTRLLNRRAFTELMTGGSETESLRGEGWIAFADIDHFKSVNDTHGHRAGDEVLVAVARRWSAALGEDATVARAGGDEFIIALPPGTVADAGEAATRMRDALTAPVKTGAAVIPVTCSIGLTEYGDGESLRTVLARADRALYVTKAAGRDGWELEPAQTDRRMAPIAAERAAAPGPTESPDELGRKAAYDR